MCSPTLVAVSLTAASTIAQGYAQKQQGEYASKVAEYNARNRENEATQTRNVGVEEENIQRQKTAELISRQRAQLGASGIEIGSGSALALQEDAALIGNVDALRIKSNFERRALASEEEAKLIRAEGAAKKEAGSAAFTGSLLTAGGAIIGSGVADKWFSSDSAAVTNNALARTKVAKPISNLFRG